MPAREDWAPVPGWPGYEASTRGRVRSVDRRLADGRLAGGVMLTPSPDKDGYLCVTLFDGPRRWRVHVARLVLLAHRGEPPTPEHEALHGNGRRKDNRLRNLRWGTRPENRADRENHQRERQARAARRAARAYAGPEDLRVEDVTEVTERETSEIDGAHSCPLRAVSASPETAGQR